jgi:hypothetical protein
MKFSVTLCGVVGEVRTARYPNSYLRPANVEMLLLYNDRVIITAFLVVFFLGSRVPLQCFFFVLFSYASLGGKINFGFKTW